MPELNHDIYTILNEHPDLDSLILKMRLYANDRLGKNTRKYEGLEPIDFVLTVFQKALEGIRNWDQSKCDFEHFVFGVLKSEINSYHNKRKRMLDKSQDAEEQKEPIIIDIQEFYEELSTEDENFKNLEVEEQKKEFSRLLEKEGCSTLELLIFDCWCSDMFKPNDISEFLEEDLKDIYNAIKRLNKRHAKIVKQYE